MSCGASHLGFPIGIKNRKFVEDLAGLSLTHDPMGKMFQNTSSLKPLRIIETKLPRNDHWKVLTKNVKFVEDLPMIIPEQFGFNCSSGFRGEVF
jgi:hypothetical protein